MIPAWLLWSTVGAVVTKMLPDDMFPKFGNGQPPARPGAPVRRVQGQAGPRPASRVPVVPPPPVQATSEEEQGYLPMDPSVPMDPWIDPETEQGVLAALSWEDDRQLDGFAQSISHEGDPYGFGYYPQAAAYLRYRAKIIREARESLARFEAEQAAKERISKGIGPAVGGPAVGGSAAPPQGPPNKVDTIGTGAPTMQAPPPSLQAVPAVRVKIRKGKSSLSPTSDSNGATQAPQALEPPTESGQEPA
jgi:hypothetical protein